MRPRHKAAEYSNQKSPCEIGVIASMRPRHKAAEYSSGVASTGGARPVLQ